ncbi:hypothetical protein POTOM_061593 [Populus tomentosa]|uniref:40S ribosomal protein S7 n=1 Tax=Populus tomentosa TaxID=118781 RepID=A0A8X7XP00_POPTO|nr:hypothetical protein POTOM_061593 [Populus tomentosa]
MFWVYFISLVFSGVADHGYCSDETMSLASSLLQVSLFQGYLRSFCEVYKSVDFLVIVCWDVILMASRRDFEASKERPRFNGLGTARSRLYMRLLLEDLVMPAEIAGESIRYRIDGSRIMKVFLDPKEHNSTDLETFSAVYRKLSGKDVVF